MGKEIIEEIEIHYCIESKEKSFDFRQFWFDAVIITMISMTVKAMIAMSVGQNIINLY